MVNYPSSNPQSLMWFSSMTTSNFLRSLQHFKIHCTPHHLLPVDLSSVQLLPRYQGEKIVLSLATKETRSYGISWNGTRFSESLTKLSAYYQNSIRIFLFSQTILANLGFKFGLFLFLTGFLKIVWTSLNAGFSGFFEDSSEFLAKCTRIL